jgi:hypothetical protein
MPPESSFCTRLPAAADVIETLAVQIARDGAVFQGPTGPRVHPGLKDQLNNRLFIARALQKLGVLEEAIKPVGRPPKPFASWRGDAA